MNRPGPTGLVVHFGDALVLRQRGNSLNFLRLVLALLVIFSHSIPIGGFGNEVLFGNQTLGDLSVDGFFAISGFLICGSADRHVAHFGRGRGLVKYFWDRVLRIFPAFWICLLITALVFGVIGYWSEHHGVGGYWSQPHGPLHYVLSNSYLRMNSYTISGTPSNVPYTLAWDGSLWTLSWEFLCYIGIAALAALGLLVRRRLVALLAILIWCGEAVIFFVPSPLPSAQYALRFGSIFITGALVYLYRDRIPDSRRLAVGSLAIACAGLGVGHPLSHVSDWITGPALVYPVLWLGAHLPFRKIGSINDLSYGVYIYAFPMGQLLAMANVQRFGYLALALSTVGATFPMAAFSWWGIEKWALRARRLLPFERRVVVPVS
jgi:peptidoglycan/LPS O-acetylase OafA/YrhL